MTDAEKQPCMRRVLSGKLISAQTSTEHTLYEGRRASPSRKSHAILTARFLFTLGEDHAEISFASRNTARNPPPRFQLFRRPAAVCGARRERCGCAWMSGLHETRLSAKSTGVAHDFEFTLAEEYRYVQMVKELAHRVVISPFNDRTCGSD